MISRTPPKIKRQTHISYPPGLSPDERIKARELMLKRQDEREELVKKQMEEVRSKLGQTNPKEFLQTTTPIRSTPLFRGKGKSKSLFQISPISKPDKPMSSPNVQLPPEATKNILDSSNILPSKKMDDFIGNIRNII